MDFINQLQDLDYTESATYYFLFDNYYGYFYAAIVCILTIIMFSIIICCQNKGDIKYHIKRQSFRQTMISWKNALSIMRQQYKKQSVIHRSYFYISRIIFVLSLCCFCYYCYQSTFIQLYLYYMTYIYLAMLVLEYFILIYSVSQTLYYNYNNVNNDSTAILIPFGGSALQDKLPTIKQVLRSASSIVKPSAVFLLHNGRDLVPKFYTEIKAICDEIGVNYIYIPLPNKSYSIYYCSKNLCTNFKQCLIIDDDVILPYDIQIPTLSTYDIVAYPICVDKSDIINRWESLLCDFQNIEYGLSGMVKLSQSRWNKKSSSLSHHGAIGLWKKEVLNEVMYNHDTIFNAEDLTMGIIAYGLGYNMKVVEGCFIPTKTPTKVFGNGGLLRQRYRSWDAVLLKFVNTYLKLFMMTSITENFVLKLCLLYELWTMFIDFQRFPIVGYILYKHSFESLSFIVIISIVNMLIVMWYNYVSLLNFSNKSSFVSIMIFPIYKVGLLVCRLIGELYELFIYRSTQQRYPSLIKYLPELPNILEDITLKTNEIEWDKIWNSDEYLHKSMRFTDNKLFNQDVRINIVET